MPKPDWITITPMSGDGNKEVSITASPNFGMSRYDNIQVKGKEIVKDVYFSQKSFTYNSIFYALNSRYTSFPSYKQIQFKGPIEFVMMNKEDYLYDLSLSVGSTAIFDFYIYDMSQWNPTQDTSFNKIILFMNNSPGMEARTVFVATPVTPSSWNSWNVVKTSGISDNYSCTVQKISNTMLNVNFKIQNVKPTDQAYFCLAIESNIPSSEQSLTAVANSLTIVK